MDWETHVECSIHTMPGFQPVYSTSFHDNIKNYHSCPPRNNNNIKSSLQNAGLLFFNLGLYFINHKLQLSVVSRFICNCCHILLVFFKNCADGVLTTEGCHDGGITAGRLCGVCCDRA